MPLDIIFEVRGYCFSETLCIPDLALLTGHVLLATYGLTESLSHQQVIPAASDGSVCLTTLEGSAQERRRTATLPSATYGACLRKPRL